MKDRRHWPDCYVNHGPPDASCDKGPDCGTVTPETLTDEMVMGFWDVLKCGDPAINWDSDAGWSEVTPEDARLALSSVPLFGVGDLQEYWRNHHAACQRICDAINARARTEGSGG